MSKLLNQKGLIAAMFGIDEMSVEEVSCKLIRRESLYIIDVRDELEWEQGRPEGAINLPRAVLKRDIRDIIPDKGADIVLVCSVGLCSLMAADILRKLGYLKVYSMAGGFRAWKAADYPIESEE